eukprot:CAMPEP_0176379478 /NCGR_PEP_ID=MMETSP0126-20121128/30384_1 /TAXON_ID=141414 ORGANISM="Strombidinopsis acuminatum, Strain SPMC142" /NCGR_SAMPLE_ID=MMETSP0126 /ASSEMBLY_ACC=CAM_ASM_000229 /LENGTH=140 /DNA_ID=CAMNT_0017742267 /DNA_START=59 /DNA_END=481 /DNA_ORIENTATION=+
MLKQYFFFACVMLISVGIYEEATHKDTSLNHIVRKALSQHTIGDWLMQSVGKPDGRKKKNKGNDRDESMEDWAPKLLMKGETLNVKEFSVEIIRKFRPAVFVGLADDWPITQKFAELKKEALQTTQPIPNYLDYFGEDIS